MAESNKITNDQEIDESNIFLSNRRIAEGENESLREKIQILKKELSRRDNKFTELCQHSLLIKVLYDQFDCEGVIELQESEIEESERMEQDAVNNNEHLKCLKNSFNSLVGEMRTKRANLAEKMKIREGMCEKLSIIEKENTKLINQNDVLKKEQRKLMIEKEKLKTMLTETKEGVEIKILGLENMQDEMLTKEEKNEDLVREEHRFEIRNEDHAANIRKLHYEIAHLKMENLRLSKSHPVLLTKAEQHRRLLYDNIQMKKEQNKKFLACWK